MRADAIDHLDGPSDDQPIVAASDQADRTLERNRVVLDNLSTYSAGALYQAFPAAEARRVLRRLEFHYVRKHAGWLNMVEIEIGVLRSQCLDRALATIGSCRRLPPGSDSATRQAHASTGCSQPRKSRQNGPRLPRASHSSQAPTQRVIIPVQRY